MASGTLPRDHSIRRGSVFLMVFLPFHCLFLIGNCYYGGFTAIPAILGNCPEEAPGFDTQNLLHDFKTKGGKRFLFQSAPWQASSFSRETKIVKIFMIVGYLPGFGNRRAVTFLILEQVKKECHTAVLFVQPCDHHYHGRIVCQFVVVQKLLAQNGLNIWLAELGAPGLSNSSKTYGPNQQKLCETMS